MNTKTLLTALLCLFSVISIANAAPPNHVQKAPQVTCTHLGCSDWTGANKATSGRLARRELSAKRRPEPADTMTGSERALAFANGAEDYETPAVKRGQIRSYDVPLVGNGVVRSAKTGATARVAAKHAPKFQAYINAIEDEGAIVYFMGGIRAGSCHMGSKHPCGGALDVCQLSRGVVDARCNLPSPARVASIARSQGLIEGSVWCSNDYGHVEAGAGVTGCAHRNYAMGRAIQTGARRVMAARKKIRQAAVQ